MGATFFGDLVGFERVSVFFETHDHDIRRSRILRIAIVVAAVLGGARCASFGAEGEASPPIPTEDAGVEVDRTPGHLTDAGDEAGQARRRLAFVTSEEMSGNIGLAPDAWDARCVTEARAAGIEGAFVAWLSSSMSRALDRLGPDEDRDWYDLKGQLVAHGKTGLTEGGLRIAVMEDGTDVEPSSNVWTGTLADGGPAGNNCGGWKLGTNLVDGLTGEVGRTGVGWTDLEDQRCDEVNRLYCFEK